jgi:hypothetical protein
MKFQRFLSLFVITFAATLALVVGQRLPSDWLIVLIGVVAGIVASIPTSLVILWVARRALISPTPDLPAPYARPEARDPEPRIIVVPATPGYLPGHGYLPPQNAPASPYAQVASPRHFTVIGADSVPEETPLLWR